VTDSVSDGADAAAWRAELERQHAFLVNVIDQAVAWAREFHVPVGDDLWGNGSSLRSYPLTAYADTLQRISMALKMACANASLDPPSPDWDRTTTKPPLPGCDPNWRDAYVVTAREYWRAALPRAAKSVIELTVGIPQLETYAAQAERLLDRAYTTVRAAYQDSVAATFGRRWAYWTDSPTSAKPLMFWMKSLTECGFSVEECEAILRDIEVADPEGVAICRERREQWLPELS
jgi:hypothetical protein